MMQIDRATAAAVKFFETRWCKPIKIVEVGRNEGNWLVRFEVTEESEYMRELARDEVVGVYLAELDSSFEVIGYRRLGLKNRTQLEEIREGEQ